MACITGNGLCAAIKYQALQVSNQWPWEAIPVKKVSFSSVWERPEARPRLLPSSLTHSQSRKRRLFPSSLSPLPPARGWQSCSPYEAARHALTVYLLQNSAAECNNWLSVFPSSFFFHLYNIKWYQTNFELQKIPRHAPSPSPRERKGASIHFALCLVSGLASLAPGTSVSLPPAPQDIKWKPQTEGKNSDQDQPYKTFGTESRHE